MIKPILCNTDMVQAILDGRKTVTRRLIKPQPIYSQRDGFTWKGGAYGTDLPPTIKGAAYNFRCAAPYQPGDILYVRETWREHSPGFQNLFIYKADYKDCNIKWHPSIHMPKEAARIWLKVKDVRAERLQEITEEEAEKEGCQAGSYEYKGAVFGQEDTDEWTAIEDYVNVWNPTVKKSDLDRYGWDANPWVWVIEFEQCEKPGE